MNWLEYLHGTSPALHDELVAIRRDLHQNPELAFEEVRTAGIVAEFLRQLGLSPQEGVAKTGVVCELKGDPNGPVVALRADMDALPIHEENETAYISQQPGKMHACGHDVHTSSLLGVAKLLAPIQHELPGTLKLIFQPSEEKLPGGASVMIAEGALQNPNVQSIVGQHVAPFLEVGQVGVRSGKYMASTDEIYLTIHGKGGHGALPHSAIDPVVIMAQVIMSLQTVVSRTADPRLPSVLTFGDVHGHGATNVIPPKVALQGTFRTFDEAWRSRAHKQIERIVQGVVEGLGGRAELEIRRGYPFLVNDEAVSANVREGLVEFMGEDQVVDLPIWPAAEDFAYYTHVVPGCFYRLGTGNAAAGIQHGLHHPRFDVDERALAHAPGLMAWLGIRELRRLAHQAVVV